MSWLSLFLLPLLSWYLISLLRALAGKWRIPIGLGSKNRLPPGPSGLPIIGNLLMFGDLPHRNLLSLAKIYGPIMSLRLGLVPAIIISSPQLAEQILKAHDLVFMTRPLMEASKYLTYGGKDLVLAPYGPYWRTARKFCTLQLLSNAKIDSFRSTRREELTLLLKSLKEIADARETANLTSEVARFMGNNICRMVFSRKYTVEDLVEKGFKDVIQEFTKLTGAFNLSDFIPFLKAFDIQGLRRRIKACHELLDGFCEKIIDERILNGRLGHQKDFLDIMLSDPEFQADRTRIKAIITDMLAAGIDTSANTIEWALSELFRHPRVMKKVQEELLQVVGMDWMIEESDLAKLEYLDMVIKETFRLHPVAPLLIHEAMEDCMVDGFYIPKKSRVLVNIFAIGQDMAVWSNAEEFFPERFMSSTIDVRGHDFQLLPFGSGRRGCPGMQLGLRLVSLILAQLVHCFDWELPNGMSPSELDMSEEFGLTVPRASHLLAMPIYRLRCDIS